MRDCSVYHSLFMNKLNCIVLPVSRKESIEIHQHNSESFIRSWHISSRQIKDINQIHIISSRNIVEIGVQSVLHLRLYQQAR